MNALEVWKVKAMWDRLFLIFSSFIRMRSKIRVEAVDTLEKMVKSTSGFSFYTPCAHEAIVTHSSHLNKLKAQASVISISGSFIYLLPCLPP